MMVAVLVGMLSVSVFAAEFGYVTVVTGEPQAKIYLDGQMVSQEYIRRYPVEVGEHYIRIDYQGKVMYAEKISVKSDQNVIVNSDNFVDLRTNVASRGAIDRETRRLQEVKGNWGFGVTGGLNYPASGISLKWFPLDFLGVQVSGMGNLNIGGKTLSSAGGRVILPLGKRVLWNSVLTGFATVGYAKNVSDGAGVDNYGASIGLEWAPFDPVYFSGEIGGVYQLQANGDKTFGTGLAVGVHVYF